MMGRAGQMGVVLAAVVALAGCLTRAERRQADKTRQRMLGDRKTESPERRTAAARPRPWVEEKHPLDTDRTGVAGQRARAHGEADSRQQPGLSYEQCLQLEEIYPCPLLVHQWRVRDTAGGVELSVAANRREADRLRDTLRCLDAHGRQSGADGCLVQFLPAQITGRYDGQTMHLRLVVQQPGRVAAVRERVRELVEEAR